MKIIIDDKICLKHKLSLAEALFALAVKCSENPKGDILNMMNREILHKEDGVCYVTQHWADVLDDILATSGGIQDEDRLKNLAIKMREAYPQGRIIDRKTGKPTPYIFRGNPKEIELKLKTFFMRYGNYSDEDILDAEKRYVATWNGNYQQPGFRVLKYFIWKDNIKQGPDGGYVESISPLLDFLENKESEVEGVVVNTNDWRHKVI